MKMRVFFFFSSSFFFSLNGSILPRSFFSLFSRFPIFFLYVTTLYKGDDGRAIKYAAH